MNETHVPAEPGPAEAGPASSPHQTIRVDGRDVPFLPGQTILQALLQHGTYVPSLCYHPDFEPHGSCRVCTVKVNGRTTSSCTMPARPGDQVELNTAELGELRKELIEFLFTEGNHFCPSCEQSGNCQLQAVGYELGVVSGHFNPLFPERAVDASHPDILLDLNRCILCELCVRASAQVDKKHVFALSGRGITKHLIVNSESGRLADTNVSPEDKAIQVCPVGVILRKRHGFQVPIGERRFDKHSASEEAIARERKAHP